MALRNGNEVEPATDEEVEAIVSACEEYLAELNRGWGGPDNKNVYQEDLLHFLGEKMPAVLARLAAVEHR